MTTRISAETAARIAPLWGDILADLAAGVTVDAVATSRGFTRGMLWAYRSKDDIARAEWNDALRDSADALYDEALTTARSTKLDSRHARVKCQVLMWAAEKRDPERYAPRSKHDLTVKTLDLSPILARAEARLALSQSAGRIVDGIVLGVTQSHDASALM